MINREFETCVAWMQVAGEGATAANTPIEVAYVRALKHAKQLRLPQLPAAAETIHSEPAPVETKEFMGHLATASA